MYSRGDIAKMKENEFRTAVLIPLFKKMGFQGVQDMHGPQEQGKDIVMWKHDEHNGRMNYSVVVKAKRVTGAASGSSSAVDVANQVWQCFTSDYEDVNESVRQRVDICWVVTTRDYTTPAQKHLQDERNTRLQGKVVKYWTGSDVWEWYEKHMLDEKQKAVSTLQEQSDLNDDYCLEHIIGEKKHQTLLKAKHDNAPPIKGSLTLTFPLDEDGKKKQEEFERFFFRDGHELNIPREMLTDFSMDLPDGFAKELSPKLITGGKLKLTRSLPDTVLPVRIEVSNNADNSVILDNIELRPTKWIDGGIVHSNEHQAIPWKIELQLAWNTRQLTLHFKTNETGLAIKRVAESLALRRLLSASCNISIEAITTGITLPPITWEGDPSLSPPSNYEDLIQKLLDIQKLTNIAIITPEDDYTNEDVQDIYDIYRILTRGEAGIGNAKIPVSLELVAKLIDEIDKNPSMPLQLKGENWIGTIFNHQIPLGAYTIKAPLPSISNVVDLKEKLTQASSDEEIEIHLQSSEEYPIIAEFPEWQKKDAENTTT